MIEKRDTVTRSAPTLAPDVAYKHILVPLNDSVMATAAWPTARALANAFGADLHIVEAAKDADKIDRLRGDVAASLDIAYDDPSIHTVIADDAARAIDRLAATLDSRTPDLGI